MQSVPCTDRIQRKIERILSPAHSLCRDDVVWMLEYIKNQVADEDPSLMQLTQQRLLRNFRYFAEVALMMIHRHHGNDQEVDRLKTWIAEAAYGLQPRKER